MYVYYVYILMVHIKRHAEIHMANICVIRVSKLKMNEAKRKILKAVYERRELKYVIRM